ncbi:hypothetical protein CP500_008985 [Tychonema bourrellyi FEM_GT703]|uniref:Uncharacterized protein n=1 Tax=Tychonema bourrellyi FEM_GT703 TaxID=2040638 RepID=A0A2G4F201_9CYAN|nr:hypothetical protein CP500_008985 [Tychonema bourrellyi FEM_GT703]
MWWYFILLNREGAKDAKEEGRRKKEEGRRKMQFMFDRALGFGGRLICGVYKRAIEVIYGC